MTKSIDEAAQDFTSDLATLRDDISKLTASVSDLVRTQASTAADTVYGAVDMTRQKFADTTATAQDRVTALSADLESAVERNPLAAIGIALGAGIVIGMLSRK